jgi:deazaflavin-dependent oxidoreductase (nitroreductase family)
MAHARFLVKWMSRMNTWIYQKSDGKIGGRFLRGAPVCLLTTTGRKSGLPRTVPLLYLTEDEKVVVVASKGGMKSHPLWYRNLVAKAEVSIQIGEATYEMVARTAEGAERAALWPKLVTMYQDYDTYKEWTEREIPVVVLEPA